MFVRPGYLSQQLEGYDREKQKTIQQNLLQMDAAGIKDPAKFIFGSNQGHNGKGIDKRKSNIGRGDGDEDYVPLNDEERLSCHSDNEVSSRSKANMVTRINAAKKKSCSTAQPLRKSQRTQEGSNPERVTRALQRPTSPIEHTDPFCSPCTVVGSVATPEIPSKVSQNNTRKRGPTKLKTIAAAEGSRVEVQFDEYGRPIGEGSVKLSSFLGALVREIVPYTISDWRKLPSGMAEVLWQSIQVRFNLEEEWHREMVFHKMDEDWRASKSRLVKKIRNASNEEERLKLQPDNIKSLHDWKDFVKEKTSADFKVKSDNFKEMRNKQLPLQHTMSRKGYARLVAEMKADKKKKPCSITRAIVWAEGHRKKNGRSNPRVEEKIEEMKKVEQDTPNLSSTNLKEDTLSKVLGPERRGRLRTFGKGVTKTKLNLLSQMSGHFSQLHEENIQLKSQMAHMQNSIDELKKNQAHNPATTEGTPTIPVVSPLSVNTIPNGKCKLLDWMGTGRVLAEGTFSSSDPRSLAHHIPIGPNAVRVWVDVPKERNAYLWRTTSDMTRIEDAVGTTVAWPADQVIMDSFPESTG